MRLDHLLSVVADPAVTAHQLGERGLGTVPGPDLYGGWASRLLPLRDNQLIYLLYPAGGKPSAAANPWARSLHDAPPEHLELVGWGVEVDSGTLDVLAERHGLRPQRQAAVLAPGTAFTWRSLADPETRIGALPYFVAYEQPAALRAEVVAALHAEAGHRVEPIRVAEVATGATEEDLRRWLGPEPALPVRSVGGPEALSAVSLELAGGSRLTIRSSTAASPSGRSAP